MKYEDLSFTIKNKEGLDVICDIVSVVPNDDGDEPYVVFTDYLMDENDEFIMQYGKLVKVDDDYVLKVVDDEKVIELIKEKLQDEIVYYVSKKYSGGKSCEKNLSTQKTS